jgi:hypothetical protein
VPIAPTGTTPLSDENAPDPPRPSAPRKKVPAPKPQGALRVDVARRSPKDSDPGSEKKPQRPAKAGAKTDSRTESRPERSAPAAPDPKGKAAPKPVWSDHTTEAPPRIPNWEHAFESTSRPDVPWEPDDQTTVGDVPVHVAPLTGRRRRSRVFVVAVVLLCLLFAYVAVAAILSSRHNPSAATAGPRAPTPSEVSVARVDAATVAADRATVTTRSKLEAIPGIPTLTNVAAVILPYVTSLQRYETALTGTVVPAAAQTGVANVRSLVAQDLQFLDTLDGLPSLRLGTYLAEVGKRSTQLQTAFRQVDRELRTAAN